MKKLFISIFILTIVDAVCTAIGVHLGVVEEANPFFQRVVMAQPVLASTAVCIGVGGILYLVYRLRDKVRFMVPLMVGLLIVKLVVVGIHLEWMAQVI